MNARLGLAALLLAFTTTFACAPRIVQEGSGGTGSGGSSSCPATNPGMCAPTACGANGYQQTGEASCVNGSWVCAQATCDPNEGCVGGEGQQCVNGQITSWCCPAGDPCDVPLFCDLGNGTCIDGVPCDELDAGAPCDKPTILASSYDQSCNVDSDCAAVFSGSLCSTCTCPNATISQDAMAAYQADVAAAGPGPQDCFCPVSPTPSCNGGVCTVP